MSKKKTAFLYLLILSFIIKTILIFYTPYDTDELLNFAMFQNKPFGYPLNHYIIPNNHVLFSFLSNIILVVLPQKLDSLYISKFFSLFFITTAGYIFHKILKLYYSPVICLIFGLLFLFIYPNLYYSLVGRGYSLFAFLNVLIIYLSIKWSKDYQNKYLIMFAISSSLGFFTVPVFLYPFLVINLFILFNKAPFNKKLVYFTAGFISILFSLILYLSIIQREGIDTIINNPYTKSLSLSHVINHLSYHLNYIWSFILATPISFYVPLILFSITFLFFLIIKISEKKINDIETIAIIGLSSYILFFISQRVLPFSRTMIYLVPYFIFILASIYNYASKHSFFNFLNSKMAFIFFSIVIIFYSIFIWDKTSKSAFHLATARIDELESEKITTFIINKKIETVYSNNPYYDTYFEYRHSLDSLVINYKNYPLTDIINKKTKNKNTLFICCYNTSIKGVDSSMLVQFAKSQNLKIYRLQKNMLVSNK